MRFVACWIVQKILILLLFTLTLTACSIETQTYGLKPLYPENKIHPGFTEWEILFTEVDSLQPLLRWESFPPPEDRELYREEFFESIINIRYDIRIWLSDNDYPGTLIYSETGLPKPQFELQKPLFYCSKYFWTVRARFEVEGKTRVTDWSISTGVMPDYLWKKGYESDWAGRYPFMGRIPFIPNPNLYRFKTPCPKGKDKTTISTPPDGYEELF
jgi:hypothetical protein